MTSVKAVENITNEIARKYKPEKIIIYGSFANGKAKKNSDLDLLIIKKTKKERTKRHLELDGLILNREIPLDILVYTPGELKKKLLAGNTFFKEIVNNGKIVYGEKQS